MKGDEQGAVAGWFVAQALQRDLEARGVEALGPVGLVQVEHLKRRGHRRRTAALVTLAAAPQQHCVHRAA